MDYDVTELLTLYEVTYFSHPGNMEELFREMIEKANRLLGAKKLALVKDHKSGEVLCQWGFKNEEQLWNSLEAVSDNSFFYPLKEGELGYLYLEQHFPLSPRDKRLFTVFARQLEKHLEHMEAQEKLRQSENEKDAILNSISEHLVFQDRNNRVLWLNHAAADSVNSTPEKVVGRYCYRVWNNREGPCANCPVMEALESGLPQEGYIGSDDGRYWFIRGYPVINSEGEVEGIVEAAMEITDKKEIEEELRASQNTFEMVFNSVNEAIFIHDVDGTVIDVNETMLKMYGLDSKKEALNLSIEEDFSGENSQVERLPLIWREVLKENPQHFEWEARRPKDGSTFEVEVFLNKLELYDREVILATVRDITARKQEERFLQNLFTYSPIGMYVVNRGKFVISNSLFEQGTGYTAEELQQLHPLELVVPEDRAEVRESAVKMLKGKRLASYEYRVRNKNGEIRWVEESVTSITFHGEISTLGSVVDVTERKKAEEQLKYLSFHDKLTGLYNRAYFEEELNRIDTSRQLPLSVIIGDLDGLKIANDFFGHHTGDEMLKEMAGVFNRSCRKEDIVCRWGGDEYAVLLPQTDRDSAENICLRIKDACKQQKHLNMPLDISLGVATKETPEQDVWELVKQAEEKMYRQKLLYSKNIKSFIINFIQSSLAEKTNETQQHVKRLEDYSLKVGRALGLSIDEINKLALTASLHDVGKIAVPEYILSKPGKLTAEEWEIIKKHPEMGAHIARTVPELANIGEYILYHHERWDGNGYPSGLKGNEIPLLSRIISVVDAYDAMVCGRNYKDAVSEEEAVNELKRCAGTQFDPEIVDIFVSIVNINDYLMKN